MEQVIRDGPTDAQPRGRARLAAKRVLPLLATLLLGAYAAHQFDLASVARAALSLPGAPLAAAALLLLVNQWLSCGRFHGILRALDVPARATDSSRANIYSIAGGMLFFSFFGQALTRAALLRRLRVPAALSVGITLLERLVSLGMLLALAALGAALLAGGLSIDLDSGGRELVEIVVVGTAGAVVATWLGLGRRRRVVLLQRLTRSSRVALRPALLWSLPMHASMAATYALLGMTVEPTLALSDALAMSFVVMLAAALPISFAGWGLRELSAAAAFVAVGMPPESGVTVGIAVGVLTLAALLVNCLLASLLPRAATPGAAAAAPASERPGAAAARGSPLDLLALLLPAAAAVAVLFQVRLPTATSAINVNLADPLAIVAAVVLLTAVLERRLDPRVWRVPGMNAALLGFTVVMLAGLLHGFARYGLIDWALYNRFVGWLVLVAFLLTGALATMQGGRASAALVCRFLVLGCVSLVAWEWLLRSVGAPLGWVEHLPVRAQAMAGNPNAFAFQLTLALAAVLAGYGLGRGRYDRLLLGALLFGVWLSGSRAAMGTAIVLLLLYPLVGGRWRDLLHGLGAAVLLALAGRACAWLVYALSQFLAQLAPGRLAALGRPATATYEVPWSLLQSDRVASLVDGFAMWLQNPLLGAGLGAFIHEQSTLHGTALVIHNSALWAAAELGLVGLLLLLALPGAVLWQLRRADRRWLRSRRLRLALAVLLAFALFSTVHDMLYQRAMWLLLGCALALPASRQRA